jgi:hypothetical protein
VIYSLLTILTDLYSSGAIPHQLTDSKIGRRGKRVALHNLVAINTVSTRQPIFAVNTVNTVRTVSTVNTIFAVFAVNARKTIFAIFAVNARKTIFAIFAWDTRPGASV